MHHAYMVLEKLHFFFPTLDRGGCFLVWSYLLIEVFSIQITLFTVFMKHTVLGRTRQT